MTENEKGILFSIKVVPRAKQTKVDGLLGDALKVRLAAPPVDGKANKACVAFFAKLLSVPKNAVEIVSGRSSRNKRICIHAGSDQKADIKKILSDVTANKEKP